MEERFITATNLRKTLFDSLDEVNNSNISKIITKNGMPYAALLSFDKYEDLLELIEFYTDDALAKEIKEAEKEIENGECVVLEEYLKEKDYVPEFVLSDKSNVDYGQGVHSSTNKQGKEKLRKNSGKLKKEN